MQTGLGPIQVFIVITVYALTACLGIYSNESNVIADIKTIFKSARRHDPSGLASGWHQPAVSRLRSSMISCECFDVSTLRYVLAILPSGAMRKV